MIYYIYNVYTIDTCQPSRTTHCDQQFYNILINMYVYLKYINCGLCTREYMVKQRKQGKCGVFVNTNYESQI